MIIGKLSANGLCVASNVWGFVNEGKILRTSKQAWKLAAWAYAVGVCHD
jgi:hypothetical protein